ncbi:MAG TPA: 50S ribosomal protein L11 methyltransferase [Candidatus Binataceae bacterium]|nr:50S ribosomal protein L11 methyltransferase [Candidatus Binataceae bacterium]
MSAQKTYAKAIFRVRAAREDDAAGILMSRGAIGCAVAGLSKPDARRRNSISLEAWFSRISEREVVQLTAALRQAGILADEGRTSAIHRIADPGWSTMWKTRFAPFRIGRRFLIVPPWRRIHEAGRVSIAIQPAQAFGTGHHPTTAGALRALEELTRTRLPGAMLDIGTGSGILAIAGALLGVRDIVAIDVDTGALENARANSELCSADRVIRFSSIPIESIRRRFDLVTANILSETLIGIARQMKRIVAPGGRLVLGGILAREADETLGAYRTAFRCERRSTNRGWTTLVLAR